MTDVVRRSTRFAGVAVLAFGLTWWALWYPWGQVPSTPLYLYVRGLRACLPQIFPDNVLCTLTSDLFVNGQFRPSQTWLFAPFLDPWTYGVHTRAYQSLLIANWVLGALCMYSWLQLFQLPAQMRRVITAMLLFSSSIVWYSAGSANIDPLALTLALMVVQIWRLRHVRWLWFELPFTLVVLSFIGGMSNTARLMALMVLGVTIYETGVRVPRRWLVYLVYFCLLCVAAEMTEIYRRDWSGNAIRDGRFALVLLGYAAMPFGAYLGVLFLPASWRLFGFVVMTVSLWLTSPNYDFDLAKGDTLYLDQGRMWLIVLSTGYAFVRAMRLRVAASLGFFALANVGLILYAELVTGKAQMDPNPRNFILVQVFFAAAVPMWFRLEWVRSAVVARASLVLATVCLAFHMLALVAIHFDSLRAAVYLEQAESRWANYGLACGVRGSPYGNVYLGRGMLSDAERCEQEWTMVKSRPPEIAQYWEVIGPKWGFYRFTFAPKRTISHVAYLQIPGFPSELADLGRTLATHTIAYGVRPFNAVELRPLSVSQGEAMLRQMRSSGKIK